MAALHIAVAANFSATLQRLVRSYDDSHSQPLAARVSTGSTGTLYHQIVHGAPFDIFFAADEKHPRDLMALGLAHEESLLHYATGQLVMLQRRAGTAIDAAPVPQSGCGSQPALHENRQAIAQRLQRARVLAIANPVIAPYGRAALQVIESLAQTGAAASGHNFKLLKARNVMHAQQIFQAGHADTVLLSMAQFRAQNHGPDNAVVEACFVHEANHGSIRQFAVAVKTAGDTSKPAHPALAAFIAHLQSPQGRRIITADGYRAATGVAQHDG